MLLQRHSYHVVQNSPWPFLASISALLLTYGGVLYMHSYRHGFFTFVLGFLAIIFSLFFWCFDVIKEATYEGMHTRIVQQGLRIGFALFIVSEIMFFFAFFWAFFHSSLAPTVQIGCVWPPMGVAPFDPWSIPLLNTFILLLSGLTITAVHHYIIVGKAGDAVDFYGYTTLLAMLFTFFQVYEYNAAPFSISDGIYGSTFYMATGFHGFHVVVGTVFIFVCFLRTLLSHFTREHHVGFEAAAWYWHFVDVVWLFLFVSIYWWGGMR